MCRITGFIHFNFNHEYDPKGVIQSMRDTMAYGGPDDAGVFVDVGSKAVVLGHRRLSILDLSASGHQPMANDDKTLWVTYNGEIYNFVEIREELKAIGYQFHSNCDTEVLLKSYEHWGTKAFSKFHGMWAFAIWDKKKDKLILCRDRVGVKPLYWYYTDRIFLFASELKAFHKHPYFQKELDKESLALYMKYGYVVAPYCIFKNAHKLEAGCFLELDSAGQVRIERYWDIKDYYLDDKDQEQKWENFSEAEIVEECEKILTKSFQLRMVADVPVGIFLSGGIDSSLLVALLQKNSPQRLRTFTIGFHEREYNEAPWAKRIAQHLGTYHTELHCTAKDAFKIIPQLPDFYDEPFGDSSAIPTYLVSQLAKGQVKVSLSADGGDELFCGYTRYWLFLKLLKRINSIPLFMRQGLQGLLYKLHPDTAVSFYEKMKWCLPKISNARDKYIKLRRILTGNQYDQLYLDSFSAFREGDMRKLNLSNGYSLRSKAKSMGPFPLLTQFMHIDFQTYLPDDILTKLDRSTMQVSLEGREPFLDHDIIEFAASLPINWKYRNKQSKYILRKVLYKYIPRELIERPKQGFGVPVSKWFKNELKDLFLCYLNKERIKKEGILNGEYIDSLLQGYLNDHDVDHYKLWFIFMFQMWKERWGI